MSEKKRLHPITMLINVMKEIKSSIIPIVVAIALFTGSDGDSWKNIILLAIPFVIILLTTVDGIASWFRFTYWVEGEEIRIEQGVFVRKKRYIPFERIQNISTAEGIIQRIFGLVTLNIETAGGVETEAVLAAIRKEEAELIRAAIRRAKEGAKTGEKNADIEEAAMNDEPSEKENVVYQMSYKEIFLFAFTSGGAIGIIAAALALISEFDEIIPFEQVFSEVQRFVVNSFLITVFLGFIITIIAYIAAIIRTMIKYANFTLAKTDNNLFISYGLLEIKKVAVPLNRIQGVEIRDNIFRNFLGYASVYLINAGNSSHEEGFDDIVILPMIKRNKIKDIIAGFLPDFKIDVEFKPVPERAKIRYIMRPLYLPAIPVLVGACFLKPWGLLLLLVLPPASYLGYLGYRFAGWNIHGNQLTLRRRYFNGSTLYMFRNRIQSLAVSKNWFQNRKNLGTISADIMSGYGGKSGSTVDVDDQDLKYIYEWYSLTPSQPPQSKSNFN